MGDPTELDAVHDALNRMRRAHRRGTGCHLTAEMLHAMSVSFIGEIWEEPDPRALKDQPHD